MRRAGKKPHIRDGFHVAMYETHPRRYPIGYTIWHWHWEIQFCWVVQGEIEFYVEENRYHLTKGQGIFINRGTLHMAKAVHSEEDAYICMDIDSGLLEETAEGYEFKINGDEPAHAFLSDLVAAGVYPDRFEIREPSLHEIFVEKVGAAQ